MRDDLGALLAELRTEIDRLASSGIDRGAATAMLLGGPVPEPLVAAIGARGGIRAVALEIHGRTVTVYVAAHGQPWETAALAWQAIQDAVPLEPRRGLSGKLRAGLGPHVAAIASQNGLMLSTDAARADVRAAVRMARRAGITAIPAAIVAAIRALRPRHLPLAPAGAAAAATAMVTIGAVTYTTTMHNPGPGAVPPSQSAPAGRALTPPLDNPPVSAGNDSGGKAAAGLSRQIPAGRSAPGQRSPAGAPGGSVTTDPLPPGVSHLTPGHHAPLPPVSVPPPRPPVKVPHTGLPLPVPHVSVPVPRVSVPLPKLPIPKVSVPLPRLPTPRVSVPIPSVSIPVPRVSVPVPVPSVSIPVPKVGVPLPSPSVSVPVPSPSLPVPSARANAPQRARHHIHHRGRGAVHAARHLPGTLEMAGRVLGRHLQPPV